MGRAFPIGRLCGIRLDVQASWFAIFAFLTLTIANVSPQGAPGNGMTYALAALTALAVFSSVVVHELAHALVARRFGVRTRSITLFLFGGVATIEAELPTPLADGLVAVAGPVASAALALLVYGGMVLGARAGMPGTLTELLAYVAIANAVLAVFNLIPAYPMDGGRVLRALIWQLRRDRDGATATASLVGIAFAGAFGIAGIVAAAATRTWQFGWYVVLAAFLLRQCWTQYGALRHRPALIPALAGPTVTLSGAP